MEELNTTIETPADMEELSSEQLKEAESLIYQNLEEGMGKYKNNQIAKQIAFKKRVIKRRNKKKLNKKFKK
jgi:heme oxygenase